MCPPLRSGKINSTEQHAAMWQLIETAPKDGTRFDAWAVHPTMPRIGVRFANVQMRGDGSGFGTVIHRPEAHWEYLEQDGPTYPEWKLTHWMHTPVPPSVSDGCREAGETEGLDPTDDSAVTEGQTPIPSPPIPEGYVLVPVNPAHESMMAGYEIAKAFGVYEARAFDLAERLYRAMISVSPQPVPSVWQPIATAPKDGTPVLIWLPNSTRMVLAYYIDDGSGWWVRHGALVGEKVSLWQPAPPPPASPQHKDNER